MRGDILLPNLNRILTTPDPDEGLQRLLVTTALGEPPHTLSAEQHSRPQDPAGHELQSDGDLPLPRGRREMLPHAVVDPVRGHHAQREELEHAAQLPADGLGRHLGAEHGNQHRGHPDADAADDPRDVEGSQGVGVEDLDDGPDAEDQRGQRDGGPAPEASGERPGEEAGEKCYHRSQKQLTRFFKNETYAPPAKD